MINASEMQPQSYDSRGESGGLEAWKAAILPQRAHLGLHTCCRAWLKKSQALKTFGLMENTRRFQYLVLGRRGKAVL